jgi:acetoin utilization deacetylase AcuC-like enzyme
MRWFYSAQYDYGTGVPGEPREVHGFVLDKPSRIRRALCEATVVAERDFEEPESSEQEDFTGLHSRRVQDDLRDPAAVARAIELSEIAALPAAMVWQAVVLPQLHAAGGTCAALAAAAAGDWAANLSGGFHHARPDRSHGFCLVNDVALAVHRLRSRGKHPRILIVDLDLHQGDGNAVFFQGDAEVFTLSVHEESLFPIPKARSDLDVGLPQATGDDAYLAAVDRALEETDRHFAAEIVVYVAGSDPFVEDPMGTLRLSAAGLAERDRRVAAHAARRDAALVALPAGGYSTASPTLTAAGFAEISRHA